MIMDAMVESGFKSAEATKKSHQLSQKIHQLVSALLEREAKEDEEKSEQIFEKYIEVIDDINNKLDCFIGEINLYEYQEQEER